MSTRWNGWGENGRSFSLVDRPHFWPALLRRIGALPEGVAAPVSLEQVSMPEAVLEPALVDRLAKATDQLLTDRESRIRHACGRSYRDLVRLRSGAIDTAPAAVAVPRTHEQVSELLRIASEARLPVVPFGGGTSVVGGVEGPPGPYLALSLRGLDRLISLDPVSHVARLEAGMLGPEVEQALGAQGFTLGHFPQSFEFSTLGGWIAARSAGQQSTRYGKIEEMVVGLRVATPAGDLETAVSPAASEGPDLNRVLAGGEGSLGVITEAWLRVHPSPVARHYVGVLLPDFVAGIGAIRALMQAGGRPATFRLSDASETEATLAMRTSSPSRLKSAAAAVVKRWLGPMEGRCLLVAGFEGTGSEIRIQRALAGQALKAARAVSLGAGVGREWFAHRFDLPYLRDVLLDRGVMVDTVETATTWSNLENLHGAVTRALQQSLEAWGTPAWVFCHVSHAYEVGASLYFTFAARQDPERPIAQWQTAKTAATEAIVACGGVLSHHHGIGRDTAAWLGPRLKAGGMALLKGAKDGVDPLGVMNPGVFGLGTKV